jgi:WD40 repeat protein
VHFCEFSPNGQYLFTGSVDGTAKIWKIDRNKPIILSDDKLVAKLEEKLPQSKVD